eukprot:COSAG01_NODE_212_length_21797_cov_14.197806_2_plen_157_part_00
MPASPAEHRNRPASTWMKGMWLQNSMLPRTVTPITPMNAEFRNRAANARRIPAEEPASVAAWGISDGASSPSSSSSSSSSSSIIIAVVVPPPSVATADAGTVPVADIAAPAPPSPPSKVRMPSSPSNSAAEGRFPDPALAPPREIKNAIHQLDPTT